jgi:hypothetical protein
MDKIRTGSGRALRTASLAPTALPVPYDPAAMPGASVLGADGRVYASVKQPESGLYAWSQLITQANGGGVLVNLDVSPTPYNTGIAIAGKVGAVTTGTGPARVILLPELEPSASATGFLGRIDFCSRSIINADDALGSPAYVAAIAEVNDGGWSASSHPTSLVFVAMGANTPSHAVRCRMRWDGRFDINNSAGSLMMRVTNDGNVLINNTTGTERLSVNGNIQITSAANSFRVGSDNVVGSRKTGWTAATGTATRGTFATASVTLPQLAERVKALVDDLISHGLIGA